MTSNRISASLNIDMNRESSVNVWLESEKIISTCYKNREIGGKICSPISPVGFYDYSRNGRTSSDVSSCCCDDESDDTNDNTSFQDTSGSSLNLRDKKNDYCIEKVRDELPAIEELTINSTPKDEEIPKIEDLTLESDCESVTINKIAELSLNGDHKPLAGVVTSVAKVIGLIVVKPPIPHDDVLLYLGSPVFLKKSTTAPAVSKYVKLGRIIDVFGPACEPYYCVRPMNDDDIEQVREGSQLFYSPDHPRTAFLCLKRGDGNRYSVLYSPQNPLQFDHRKGHPGDKAFWSNASESNSSHRQTHRRRRRGSNRGAYVHRNKYRNDLYAALPIQPKHSYFDY